MAREFVRSQLREGGWLHFALDVGRNSEFDLPGLLLTRPEEGARFLCACVDQLSLDAMTVKYVAYALGQLGFESSLPLLDMLASRHPASGVRSAAGAAGGAIRQAPADRGCDESQRLALIDELYYS